MPIYKPNIDIGQNGCLVEIDNKIIEIITISNNISELKKTACFKKTYNRRGQGAEDLNAQKTGHRCTVFCAVLVAIP